MHDSYTRGKHTGIVGDPWGASGKNNPESNLWTGAFLWRISAELEKGEKQNKWRERAIEFLLNSISVPADASCDRIVDGKPVSERHRGANFFDNFGLDHHSYCNVGYQFICISQAAFLHFDLRAHIQTVPQALDWHLLDLWHICRKEIFNNGRLARIGGDNRVRYAYCQEYAIPSILYAAHRWGDREALQWLPGIMELIRTEWQYSGDHSFFGQRLAELKQQNPYYWFRLETDRAAALAMLMVYGRALLEADGRNTREWQADDRQIWIQTEQGAALHHSPERFASFVWRAQDGPSGLCLHPDHGNDAEWLANYVPQVSILGEDLTYPLPGRPVTIDWHDVKPIDGGFTSIGSYTFGKTLNAREGWTSKSAVTAEVLFIAVPDQQTIFGLHRLISPDWTLWLKSVAAINLWIPNDVYQQFNRSLHLESGLKTFSSPPAIDEILSLESDWACIQDNVGVLALEGACLHLDRSTKRRAGALESLYVDRLFAKGNYEAGPIPPNSVILNQSWLSVVGADPDSMRQVRRANHNLQKTLSKPEDNHWAFVTLDGTRYDVVANFGENEALPKPDSIPLNTVTLLNQDSSKVPPRTVFISATPGPG